MVCLLVQRVGCVSGWKLSLWAEGRHTDRWTERERAREWRKTLPLRGTADWQIYCVCTGLLCSSGLGVSKGTPLKSACLFSQEGRCRGEFEKKCLIRPSWQLTVSASAGVRVDRRMQSLSEVLSCQCVFVQRLRTCRCKEKLFRDGQSPMVCDSSHIPFRCSISAVSESPCSSDREEEGGRESKGRRADNKGGWYDERKIVALSYSFHLTPFCSFHLAYLSLSDVI